MIKTKLQTNKFNRAEGLTPFQWKVLQATLIIPLGETRSYKWIAQKTGNPQAVRAVGRFAVGLTGVGSASPKEKLNNMTEHKGGVIWKGAQCA